ncbi:MAG TPA: hypothetical protein VFE47_05165 [Tepidisphaeraceae bacterium]|nr:hypothetical protein [Tepidisphaeraceae bacterium]
MRKFHFYCSSLFILGLLAGCKPPTQQTTAQPPTAMNEKSTAIKPGGKTLSQQLNELPDTDKPAIADLKGADAAAVAQATEDYTRAMNRAMEALIKKRKEAGLSTNLASLQKGNGALDPSKVHFEDTAKRPQASDAATANRNASPAGATLPGAPAGSNQIASLTPTPAPAISVTPPRPDLTSLNKDPASNTALINAQPAPLPASDAMAQKLAKQVHDYPEDIAAQLDWQLLQMLQGQSVPQLQTLAPLQAEDREMLSAILDGMTNFRNALRADNNMLLSRKIRPILDAADRLKTQAELSIPTVALCTDVKGFGVYEPLEPARFPADGKDHRVIVYCEVENFSSQLDEQKRWETRMMQDVVLYTEQNGLEVWRDKTPGRPIVDYSRNRRHDFFIVKMIRLPANLTIGRYLLKVTVTDQEVNRVAENTVPVVIVAQ